MEWNSYIVNIGSVGIWLPHKDTLSPDSEISLFPSFSELYQLKVNFLCTFKIKY